MHVNRRTRNHFQVDFLLLSTQTLTSCPVCFICDLGCGTAQSHTPYLTAATEHPHQRDTHTQPPTLSYLCCCPANVICQAVLLLLQARTALLCANQVKKVSACVNASVCASRGTFDVGRVCVRCKLSHTLCRCMSKSSLSVTHATSHENGQSWDDKLEISCRRTQDTGLVTQTCSHVTQTCSRSVLDHAGWTRATGLTPSRSSMNRSHSGQRETGPAWLPTSTD